MKKITMSLISLIVLGTSTGFCKSTPKSNTGGQPRQEVIQDQRQKITPESKGNTYQMTGTFDDGQNVDLKPGSCKKTKCDCKECQKKSKKHIGKHQVQVRKSQLKQHCPKK